MWTYLIRTIDYILAPTKHLENIYNYRALCFYVGNFHIINNCTYVSQIAQWLAGWHSASMVYCSNLKDYILFFTEDYSSLKKIFHHDSSSSCQESWNPIHNWWYYTIVIIQYQNIFKKRIAQWLADWYAMLKAYDASPESDTLCMTEEDFIV